jgi:membrane carboxypeptidase/penicillin-binding protein
MISIRILHRIGAKYGQEYATRFGFDADKNPPYLTLALGAGNVTPLHGRRLRGVRQRRLQGQPLPDPR